MLEASVAMLKETHISCQKDKARTSWGWGEHGERISRGHNTRRRDGSDGFDAHFPRFRVYLLGKAFNPPLCCWNPVPGNLDLMLTPQEMK